MLSTMIGSKEKNLLQKIHHLSFSSGSFVNDYISQKVVHLCYTILTKMLQKTKEAKHYCVIVKNNIEDTLQKIFLALNIQ